MDVQQGMSAEQIAVRMDIPVKDVRDITPYYFILLSITNQEKDAVYKRRPENEFIILEN